MTSEDVTTAMRFGRARSGRRGLDRLQSLLDALDGCTDGGGGGGAHRCRLIPGDDAGRCGEDVRVADDRLDHRIVWIGELRADLIPREVLENRGVIARGVQGENSADVDEGELARLAREWRGVVLGEDARDLRGHRLQRLLTPVLDFVVAEVEV